MIARSPAPAPFFYFAPGSNFDSDQVPTYITIIIIIIIMYQHQRRSFHRRSEVQSGTETGRNYSPVQEGEWIGGSFRAVEWIIDTCASSVWDVSGDWTISLPMDKHFQFNYYLPELQGPICAISALRVAEKDSKACI